MNCKNWINTYIDYLQDNLSEVTKKQTFTFLMSEYVVAFDDLTEVLDSPQTEITHEALEQAKSAVRALAKLDFIGQAISQCAQQEGDAVARIGEALQKRIN
jgi:hypothetical protein